MSFDVAIIGAGMAGASLAAELAGAVRVLLLEAEEQPGYHATGRSAAFWSKTYGGPSIVPLTLASESMLRDPPADFSDAGFLSPVGELNISDAASIPRLDAMAKEFAAACLALERVDHERMTAIVPGLRPRWIAGLYEPSCANIDVAALHQAYLSKARRGGVELRRSVPVRGIGKRDNGWSLDCGESRVSARIVVNAAGAWADAIAQSAALEPLGIAPYRRTVAQLRTEPPAPPNLPLVIDVTGRFYFKREAGGRLWLSPHDETPDGPGDVAPDELDIAVAIDRFEQVVDWRVERVERKWAGLRSFAPDRLPVYGFDPRAEGFFWFAGQGGFGIQTAPAAARLAAALLTGRPPHASVAHIDATPYAPDRLLA